ncbi:MAG: Ribosomal protein [Candidatus Parcubacteria bacterium]|jgi:ribosomal protein L29
MTDFKGKNKKDLVKTLIEKRDALQSFRFNIAGARTKNVKEGRSIRKDIARIETELTSIAKAESAEVKKA